MSTTSFRKPGAILGIIAVFLGGGLILATVLWGWGHFAYGLGVAVVALGMVRLLVVTVRSIVWRVVGSAGVVLSSVPVPSSLLPAYLRQHRNGTIPTTRT